MSVYDALAEEFGQATNSSAPVSCAITANNTDFFITGGGYAF